MNRILMLALAAFLSLSPFAMAAKHCAKGKPCGNTCISKNDVCHKGEGSAEAAAAPEAAAPAGQPASNPAPAQTEQAAKAPKQCKKGKPCGNTCIPQKAVCHS